MTWLDRAIGYFSPAAGLRRARMRRAMDAILAYEGAKTGRRTDGWITTGASANAEVGAAMVKIRERARDLVRNNPFAARAISAIVCNAVGTGIVPQARSGVAELDRYVDELFARWSGECDADGRLDFFGLQALVTRTIVESGEVLVRLRDRRPEDRLSVPLQLQVLEPDLLDQTKTEPTKSGGYIIHGVEFDAIGHRVAYWLFPQHPGEVGIISKPRLTSQRVEADSVLHIYRKDRPGQVRAVSWFAPIVLKMRDLAEYEEAGLVRKKVEACFAAFVTQPEGAEGPTVAPTTTENGKRIETLEPGMIEYLKPGEGVAFGAPSGVQGYADYKRSQLHDIATGLDLTYELLSGDLSQVNYSSIRAGLLEFWRAIDVFRWHVLIPAFCSPVWARFIERGTLARAIPAPEGREIEIGVEWTPPAYQSVDREKEAKADLLEIRMGTKTLKQAIAEKGSDPNKQLAEIAEINEALDDLGIVVDCDPRKAAKSRLGRRKPPMHADTRR